MPFGIVMLGPTIFGQILVETLVEHELKPKFIVLETQTVRAKRARRWLMDNNDPDPALNADKNDITIIDVDDFQGTESREYLRLLNPDFIINGGAGLFDDHFLSLAKRGFLNVHPGLLPKFRGLDPVLWALELNENVGATVHFIDGGIDTGDILLSEPFVDTLTQYSSIRDYRIACMEFGVKLLAQYLKHPEKYPRTKQDAQQAKYFGKFPQERLCNLWAKATRGDLNDV